MPLEFDYDITNLRGAEYNPRHIGADDLKVLAESITKLGLVKPLIVRGDLLVAGHQRTKALRSIGVNKAPVYVLPCETTTYDEVRFNQLHNGTDLDGGDENARVKGGFTKEGYQSVKPEKIEGNFRAKLANVRAEICDLLLKYGPWGGCVATMSGEIIHCGQYALACGITKSPLTVYVVPDKKKDIYVRYLSRQYGVFSYDKLKRDTFIQTFAQMYRLRKGPSGRENKSVLYEKCVIPWLQSQAGKKIRGIDFGSGQGDYAKMLRQQGVDLLDLEFFRRAVGREALDVKAVNRMIDQMMFSMNMNGPFDFVVCDSVLNSVDCLAAESAVMTMLNFLCKEKGQVFFSGRKLERTGSADRFTKAMTDKRNIEFLDVDGFSALYRKGRWFYQKFHDEKQINELCQRFKLGIKAHGRSDSSTSWQVQAEKTANLSLSAYGDAIRYEFNLPITDTRKLERHEDVLRVMEKVYGKKGKTRSR